MQKQGVGEKLLWSSYRGQDVGCQVLELGDVDVGADPAVVDVA